MVAKHVALYGILALGMTFVIITGGIDLSVGSVVGLVGMLAGGMIQEGITLKFAGVTLYFSVPVIIITMLVVGCIIGTVNGLIVTKLGVAPFIATLGTMYICRGFANLRSNGATFSDIKGYDGLGNTGFKILGSNIAGIPTGVYIFAVLAIISVIILKKLPFGWYVLAVGEMCIRDRFIAYEHVIKRCENACKFHSQLVSNLLQMIALRASQQANRIYVLSRNSIRKKIMTYLNSIAAEKQTKTVILPMSYTTLAEYLSVDRSAMMRELKNLADEGIIERDGKKLRILD